MKKWIIGAVIIAVALIGWGIWDSKQPGELDAFAQCLGEKGALFYGAFWCPHCADQKKMFGRSVDELPYIECSTPDGKSQTQQCIEEDISSYPTWKFSEGENGEGVLSLEELAERTGCELPETY